MHPEASQSSETERLETWDQIAFHLGITRATAQRWEREGLPVHRLVHSKVGRVFAHKTELDAWVRSRTMSPGPERTADDLGAIPAPEEPPQQAEPGHRPLFPPGVRRAAPYWLGVPVILAVIALLTPGLRSLRGSHGSNPAEPLLPGYAGVQEAPDLSPDGTSLVFAWDENHAAQRHIFVAPRSGGAPLKVTALGNSDTFPRWSPDGRHIAFGRYDWQGRVHLTVITAQGRDERTIAVMQGDATYLAWTPDGNELLFADRIPGDAFALFSVNPVSSERRQVTTPPKGFLGDLQCAVSPNGKLIALARFQNAGEGDIFVMPREAGPVSRLTRNSGRIEGLTWADDTTIVYSATQHTSRSWLWSVGWRDGKASDPVRLHGVEADAVRPRVSAGSNRARLVYQRRRLDAHVFMAERTAGKWKSMPVTAGEGFQGMPAVSSPGDSLAFFSDLTGYRELYVTSWNGADVRRITDFRGVALGSASWSPSGKQIAFSGSSGGFCGIYLAGADGQGLVRMLWEAYACGRVSWSRDERSIYFSSTRSGSPEMWKMATDGQDIKRLTFDGGFEGYESPDGTSFYYLKEGGPVAVTAPSVAVYRIPANGGATVEMPLKARTGFWTVTDAGILFLRLWENDVDTRVRLYRFSTGSVEPVFTIPVRSDRLQRISASHDGRLISWEQMEPQRSEAMLMDAWTR